MNQTPTKDADGMTVTVRASMDPKSDLWMVTGPYWFTGRAEDEAGHYSVLIEGEADAMDHARELAAEVEGCDIKVFGKVASAGQT